MLILVCVEHPCLPLLPPCPAWPYAGLLGGAVLIASCKLEARGFLGLGYDYPCCRAASEGFLPSASSVLVGAPLGAEPPILARVIPEPQGNAAGYACSQLGCAP